jgi:cysteine/O-acetylserine efflux protein
MAALVASTIFAAFPALDPILSIIGVLYINWLVYVTYRKGFQIELQDQPVLGFKHGFFMQFVNLKGLLFGLTLFSTFFAPLQGDLSAIILAVICIAFSAFSTAAVYAIFGSTIRRYFNNPRVQRAISAILSFLLFLTVLRILGLFDWLKARFFT